MRDDEDVVLEAICSKPIIIKYASKRLRANKNIAKVALQKNKSCFEFLDESLKDDEEIKNLINSQFSFMNANYFKIYIHKNKYT